MTKILKGEESAYISLKLQYNPDFQFIECNVEITYQGVKRRFSGITSGDIVNFRFTPEETASMLLGVWPVTVKVITVDGKVTTLANNNNRIEVTDCAEDVRSSDPIVADVNGLFGIDGIPERYTDEDLRDKVNEIISRLGGKVEE